RDLAEATERAGRLETELTQTRADLERRLGVVGDSLAARERELGEARAGVLEQELAEAAEVTQRVEAEIARRNEDLVAARADMERLRAQEGEMAALIERA